MNRERNKKSILYIGGFEMPDKNAAAQRVLSVSKALREIGYDVYFYGITKSEDNKGVVDGFQYEAINYPSSTLSWIKYAIGTDIISYINSIKPQIVVTYNYPAIAQERVIRYCKNKGIKTIGDITEWYDHKNLIKKTDTALRMHWSNMHLDGIISISHFLYKFYEGKRQIELPPLIDKSETKWIKSEFGSKKDKKIQLVYIGSTGIGKDRLDYIIKGMSQANSQNFFLDVIGMTETDYNNIYKETPIPSGLSINFHGRLPHQEAIKMLKQADFHIFFRNPTRVNNAGFPTKFVESFSAGIPVITNQFSNISDYVIDGKNSFIIDTPSENNIIKILQRISQLNHNDIQILKMNIKLDCFDYHKYLSILKEFFTFK